MTRFLAAIPRRLFLLAMFAGAGLILSSSLGYFDPETLHPFIVEKLPVRFEALWLFALKVHVVSTLAFPLCLLLMTQTLRRRVVWHRRIGRIAGALVLFGLVPSGVILAFDAKGGPLVSGGFLLSAAIVGCSMTLGVIAARRHDVFSHQRAMRHVVAQMSVAVTSRALMIALDATGLEPELTYVVALWGPVVVSAGVAEVLSRRNSRLSIFTPVFERIRRDSFPLASLVRVGSVARASDRVGR